MTRSGRSRAISSVGPHESADLRHRSRLRVAAERGHADDAIAEAKREQRFRNAGRRRDNPLRLGGLDQAAHSCAAAQAAATPTGARPPVAILAGLGAKRRVHTRVEFQFARKQPQQIGQPVQIRNNRRLHRFARFAQAHDTALGATANCSREVGRPPRVVTGAETSPTACLRSPSSRWTSAVRRSAASAAITTCGFGLCGGVASDDPILKSSAWMSREFSDPLVVANRSRETQRGIQLVDAAVGVDAGRSFRHADSTTQDRSPPSPRVSLKCCPFAPTPNSQQPTTNH